MSPALTKPARAALAIMLATATSACVAPLAGPGRPAQRAAHRIPPRVAVASFENRSGFAGQWELGNGMAELLTAELVASGRFTVLERSRIDAVMDEIARQQHRLFRPEGRLEPGRLKHTQYLIRGTVTDFSQVSGGKLWMGMRRWLLGGGGHTARVALTLTIIDLESGTIIDSVNCVAKARAREAFAEGRYKNVAFGGDQFFRTPLGDATSKAIRQGLRAIIRTVPQDYWQPLIAEVSETRMMLNGGRDRGIRVGQFYQVRERGQPVTDPATGDVLETLPGAVRGLIQVREVRDGISIAEAFSGAGFARGQYLEPVPVPTTIPVTDLSRPTGSK